MIWHDYAVIKLNYLFESLNIIGLVKRVDAQLRLWFSTGTVNVSVADADAANTAYNLIPSNNTFSNTCPLIVNYQEGSATSGTGLLPVNTTNIAAGLYIAKPPTTSFAGVNLAAATQQHPLGNCRLYYSLYYSQSLENSINGNCLSIKQLPFILFSSNCRSSKID